MAWQRGDIVVVDFPFVDRTGSKLRPALIVSSPIYHADRPQDVILAVISTQTQKHNGNTDILFKIGRQPVSYNPPCYAAPFLLFSLRVSVAKSEV